MHYVNMVFKESRVYDGNKRNCLVTGFVSHFEVHSKTCEMHMRIWTRKLLQVWPYADQYDTLFTFYLQLLQIKRKQRKRMI